MVKKHLVTVPMKSLTATTAQSSNLYLGPWCSPLFGDLQNISDVHNVLPYHWANPSKFEKDFPNVCEVYERLLIHFSKSLGQTLNTTEDVDYWRLIIGPWLYTFTFVFFDRWRCLEEATANNVRLTCTILERPDPIKPPYSFDEFDQAISGDHFNEMIWSKLILRHFSNQIEVVSKVSDNTPVFPTPKSKDNAATLQALRNVAFLWQRVTKRINHTALINTYLPFKSQALMQIRLGEIPTWMDTPYPNFPIAYDQRIRKKLAPTNKSGDVFFDILLETATEQIPRLYLEGFHTAAGLADKLPLPDKPKKIFTCNGQNRNEIFKIWAAKNVLAGAELLIGQHGGHYGIGKLSINALHERNIAHKWLSWGWNSTSSEKVVATGSPKLNQLVKQRGNKYKPDKTRKNLLLVTMQLPRYFYQAYSVPFCGQVAKYLEDQILFIENLKPSLQKEMRLRQYKKDYGWGFNKFCEEKLPSIVIEKPSRPFIQSLDDCRVFIGTYNATTYLEAFVINIPSVLFWRSKYWALTNTAAHMFQELEDCGVFHDCPIKAAAFLNTNCADIEGWWYGDRVQKIRAEFCNLFAATYRADERFVALLSSKSSEYTS